MALNGKDNRKHCQHHDPMPPPTPGVKEVSNPTSSTSTHQLEKASRVLAQSLFQDLPLLMYGSGDIYPYSSSHPHLPPPSSSTNNPDRKNSNMNLDSNTVSLLSELTAGFIFDLVTAAVDSHDIYTDGENGDGGGIIPMPVITSSFTTTKNEVDGSSSGKNSNDQIDSNISRKRHSRDWEEELPMPIILSKKKQEPQQQKTDDQHQNKNYRREDWQGVAGVDIRSNKVRSKYMTSTNTINEKSFLLPVYHDKEMYNRAKEILSFHNSALETLFDPGVRQFLNDVEEEGMGIDGMINMNGDDTANDRTKRQRKESNSANNSMEIVHNWQGIDDFLPVHSNKNY